MACFLACKMAYHYASKAYLRKRMLWPGYRGFDPEMVPSGHAYTYSIWVRIRIPSGCVYVIPDPVQAWSLDCPNNRPRLPKRGNNWGVPKNNRPNSPRIRNGGSGEVVGLLVDGLSN